MVLFSLLVSAGVGAVAYYLPVVTATLAATGHTADLPSPTAAAGATQAPATSPPAPGAPFTVLLLGSDNDQKFDTGTYLTQSMILIRVDPAAKKATMLSIPRDLFVASSACGECRIDEVFSYGGPSSSIATVQRDFQVHIDDYIWIGLEGLIKVINLLGGVDVIANNPVLDDYYPADIGTQNPYGFQRVAVLPGPQHMDGTHALEYVRSRHSDLRGDFARSQRQQQVLVALRAKAAQISPGDLPDLANALGNEIRTSMSIQRVAQVLPLIASLPPEAITQVVLLGDYTYSSVIGGADVLIPNWSLILPLVHKTFPAA